MAVQDLLNIGQCSLSGFRGTNNDYCILDIKRIKKLLRTSPGFKFPVDFEFTYDNILLEEQKGNIIPIYTLVDNTYTTAENGVQTFGGGTKALIEKLPIEMQAKLLNGVQGYQNTISIESAKVHGFFIVDVDDTVFGYRTKDGLFGAITSPFMQVMPYTGAGDESAGYMIEWQLDRNQFDTGLMGLRSSEYDFDISDVKGATNLEIDVETAAADTETDITVDIFRSEDKVPQLGLSASEIAVFVNGVAATVTVVEGTKGRYVLTLSAAVSTGDEIEVKINDGTYDTVNFDGVLLKSNTAEFTVIA